MGAHRGKNEPVQEAEERWDVRKVSETQEGRAVCVRGVPEDLAATRGFTSASFLATTLSAL